MVGAIGLFDIAVRRFEIFEVHVDIGHRDAFRIEETLEQKLVLDRVEVGDPQAVGHDATGGGTAARTHEPTFLAHGPDVILHDEEVVGEAHRGDGLQLEVDAFFLLGGERLAVTDARALIGEMAQIGHGLAEIVAPVVAFRIVLAGIDIRLVQVQIFVDVAQEGLVDLEFGQDVIVVDLVEFHLVGDFQRPGDDFGMVGEQRGHLFLALEEFLLGVAEAFRIVDVGVGGQADEAVVRRAVLLADEVDVVGRHHFHAQFFGQREEDGIDFHLGPVHIVVDARHFRLVLHHLQIIVVAEHLFVPADGFAGGVDVPVHDVAGNLAGQAGGAADQVLVVLLDHLVRHARRIVEPVDVPFRADLHQVLVAFVILGQQGEVIVAAVVVVLEVMVVMPRHIHFAADDRLDDGLLVRVEVALVVGKLEELLHAVHVAVVGDGQGRHVQLAGAGEQFLNIGKTVENRVLRVDVKVYE